MNEIDFVSDVQSSPAKAAEETDTTLSVVRATRYTTVTKNGKTVRVPYNPGRFELLRAAEFYMSGVGTMTALIAIQNSCRVGAAICLLLSVLEFCLAMTRASGSGGLGRLLLDDESSRETRASRKHDEE